VRQWLRRILSWKYLFYDLILPALRLLGPRQGDALLGWLGRGVTAVQPRNRSQLRTALEHARTALDADWPIEKTLPLVAANKARFLARDYPLDSLSDQAVLERFDVKGYHQLRAAMANGRGAILVGSHLGAHIAGIHWLYRRGIPVRLLVQRPKHVSKYLIQQFDSDRPHPQNSLFLRRNLSSTAAIERIMAARAALRDGLAIYLNGDIPWAGPNTCEVDLLGRAQRFSSIWTELAELTRAPVFLLFCTHKPGGQFGLDIEPMGQLRAGEEPAAVADYLRELQSRIANSPENAVAHLTWPCYEPQPNPISVPGKSQQRPAPAIHCGELHPLGTKHKYSPQQQTTGIAREPRP
jgi:phosphatidylinositol dimannoside acyltransferase